MIFVRGDDNVKAPCLQVFPVIPISARNTPKHRSTSRTLRKRGPAQWRNKALAVLTWRKAISEIPGLVN